MWFILCKEGEFHFCMQGTRIWLILFCHWPICLKSYNFFILFKNWNVWHLSYFVWWEGKHALVGQYNTNVTQQLARWSLCHALIGWKTATSCLNSYFTWSYILSFYCFTSAGDAKFQSWEFN
jgi:hypothetical protein